ncbi:MAG TPA: hypothetical protein DIT76_04890 [Spartobacteria bacterium]|nr:hypothetical protein [Spartobacteria bacterium]
MNLETINTLAQLIAAVGVIASLFYLGVQIRQSTRSMRAVVVDSLARSIADVIRPMAEDRELMRAFHVAVEDWHGATEDDRMRALPLFFSTFKLFENAWFQQRQGTLAAEQWQGWDAYIRMYYHRPGVKTWWQLRKAAFAPGFRDYVQSSEPINELPSVTQLIRGGA